MGADSSFRLEPFLCVVLAAIPLLSAPFLALSGEWVVALALALVFGPLAVMGWVYWRPKRWRMHAPVSMVSEVAVILRYDRRTLVLHALLSLSVGTGFFIALFGFDDGDSYGNPFERAFLMLVALFFFGFGANRVWRAIDDIVALRVDAAGIGFHEAVHPVLRWHQLERVDLFQGGSHPVIGFYLRENAGDLMNEGKGIRILRLLNARIGNPDFRLFFFGLNVPAEPVLNAVDRLRERYA